MAGAGRGSGKVPAEFALTKFGDGREEALHVGGIWGLSKYWLSSAVAATSALERQPWPASQPKW